MFTKARLKLGRILGKFFSPGFIQETPSGATNGTNVTFTLANTPASTNSLIVFLNGIALTSGTDYTVSGVTITFQTAPLNGQSVYADYIKAN